MTPIQIVETLAVISFSIYGVLLASRSGMDVTGMFAVAFAAAFGGGTVRDLCLDRHPMFWIQNAHYPVIVFAIAMLALFLPKLLTRLEGSLLIPDAVGLGLFTIAGADLALKSDTTLFLATLFGVVTGCLGGVMADIACNRIPTTFRPGAPLNITCSFVGGWCFVGGLEAGLPRPWAMVLGAVVVTVFRIVSVKRGWSFPTVGEDAAS